MNVARSTPPIPRQSSGKPESTTRLALVWLWLAVYVVAFFLWPLNAAPAGSPAATSRIYVWQALLVPDEFIANWFLGFSPPAIFERVGLVLVAVSILTVALSAGWLALRTLRLDQVLSQVEMSAFALGVGLNLVSLSLLALGLARLLRADLLVGGGLVVMAGAGLVYWRRGCASCSRFNDDCPGMIGNRWLWLAAPFAVAMLLSALLPPFDFDVREYHLQAPKEFFLDGRITFLPHNVYANMPLGTEMLSLAAMVLTGDWWNGALVGKLLIACFAPLTSVLLYAAGCRLATRAAGIVAAIVYLTTPWILSISSNGLIEAVFAFYLFAALYAALIWNQWSRAQAPEKPAAWTGAALLLLAGFLAGGAAATKYPAMLYVVAPLAALIAGVSWQRSRTFQTPGRALLAALRSLAIFLLAASVGCGLWYAKNAVLTGNPVYPLLYQFFSGETRTPEIDLQWQQAHRPPNFQPRDLLARSASALIGSDWLSPLLIPLAGLAWLVRPARRVVALLWGYLLFVFLTWWLLTHRIDRFLVPVLPLAALLAGIGATWSGTQVWRRTLLGLFAVGLAFNFLLLTGGILADNRYLQELSVLRSDPLRVEPWRRYFNEHADEVTGLLLVGDAQPFDLIAPTTYNTVFDPLVFESLARDKTPAQVRAALAQRRLSHLYVAWNEIARYRSPGNYGFSDFVEPKIFDDLVRAGVLEPIGEVPNDAGQAYRVRAARGR